MKLEQERTFEQERIIRVGISGSYGGMNLGDEAILQVITAELRSQMPVEIVVFSKGPEDTLARHDVEQVLPVLELSRAEAMEEVKRLDLFVLGGGGLLFNGKARHFVRELRIAKELGIPAMTWAIGAGPMEDREDRCAVRRALTQADAIVVRQELDRDLLQDIGVARDVCVTADPAFLMKPEPFTPDMLKGEGLDPNARLIGICTREPSPSVPSLKVEHYHSLVANAADFFVERMGATVVFVPMERLRRDLHDAHAIVSRMVTPQKARVLQRAYTPGQVLGFMSHLEFALSMRLHFLIFATLAGVPFVPLPFASKVKGFSDKLGIAELPVQDLDAGRLLARIDWAWDIRDELRSRLTERLPPLIERASKTVDFATALVRNAVVTNP